MTGRRAILAGAGRTLKAGLLACLCCAPPLLAQQNVHAKLIPVAKRKTAPGFHLVSATGAMRELSSYRGKVILLNFWATRCGGCVLEIPSLIQIQKAFHGEPFTDVGVSMDISYENLKGRAQAWSRVRPFAASHHMSYPILMANRAVPRAYGIRAMPDTFLIDKQGRIAAVYVGMVNQKNVEANVRQLLAEPGKPAPPCAVKPVPCTLDPAAKPSPGSLTVPSGTEKPVKPMLMLPAAGAPTTTSIGTLGGVPGRAPGERPIRG